MILYELHSNPTELLYYDSEIFQIVLKSGIKPEGVKLAFSIDTYQQYMEVQQHWEDSHWERYGDRTFDEVIDYIIPWRPQLAKYKAEYMLRFAADVHDKRVDFWALLRETNERIKFATQFLKERWPEMEQRYLEWYEFMIPFDSPEDVDQFENSQRLMDKYLAKHNITTDDLGKL